MQQQVTSCTRHCKSMLSGGGGGGGGERGGSGGIALSADMAARCPLQWAFVWHSSNPTRASYSSQKEEEGEEEE